MHSCLHSANFIEVKYWRLYYLIWSEVSFEYKSGMALVEKVPKRNIIQIFTVYHEEQRKGDSFLAFLHSRQGKPRIGPCHMAGWGLLALTVLIPVVKRTVGLQNGKKTQTINAFNLFAIHILLA